VLGVSKKGVNFEALDGEPVYILFLLVAPKDTAGPHLKALAQISRLLRDSYFCELLRRCKTPKEVFDLIAKEESRKV
jgi:mannitol/fructose-specific phosphotransferase system IIA component (Ntr-type)